MFHKHAQRLILSLVLAGGAATAAPSADNLFAEIDAILTELTKITGLKVKHPVAYDMMGRDKLKRFLDERIAEIVKPEEIRAEEITLKKFGFIPQDYDLRARTVELLTEQAAAFYDFKKKKLFVLEGASSQLQQAALVHELAHALADQHFNLEKFIDLGGKSDDASTARMAVMEGQASWLMSEYAARQMGRSLNDARGLVETMAGVEGSGQFPVFDKAPLYIRETLLFPYTSGMLFQHTVYEELGKAGFAEVFRRPPVTTQQILHSNLYFSHRQPTVPVLPAYATNGDWREVATGTVGELDHSILLRPVLGKQDAAALAAKWSGGRYRIVEPKEGQAVVLAYASDWQSDTDAEAFFKAYELVLKGKWKTFDVRRREANLIQGRGDDGEFQMRREARRVTSLEGMPQPLP